jgi:hypothetical protein
LGVPRLNKSKEAESEEMDVKPGEVGEESESEEDEIEPVEADVQEEEHEKMEEEAVSEKGGTEHHPLKVGIPSRWKREDIQVDHVFNEWLMYETLITLTTLIRSPIHQLHNVCRGSPPSHASV